ncbi:MAG: hypothetical protein VW270_23995, partial [Candidatus Poseidoniales archaeon]
MAQRIINVGEDPNDGSGDDLRTAFTKVNDNFTEIYTAGPVGSNIRIDGNVVSTTTTNANIVLSPNGTGKVQVTNDLLPDTSLARYLGANSARWRGGYFGTAGIHSTGDIVTDGNITANNINYVGSNFEGDLYGSVYLNDSTIAIDADTGNVYFANAAFSGDITEVGNIIPSANATYNLGNSSYQWKDLYISGNTINMGGVALTSDGTNVFIDGDIIATGNNIDAASISNGTSNIKIVGSDGNATVSINGSSNVAVFSTDGLEVAANVDIGTNYILGNGFYLTGTEQGAQGAQGTNGTQGIQGPQDGAQGTQGAFGLQGTQGTQGVIGSQGITGATGDQGDQGTTGTQGTTGDQGITGAQGTDGTQGTSGTHGTQGQAIKGTTGTQGATATQGPYGTI